MACDSRQLQFIPAASTANVGRVWLALCCEAVMVVGGCRVTDQMSSICSSWRHLQACALLVLKSPEKKRFCWVLMGAPGWLATCSRAQIGRLVELSHLKVSLSDVSAVTLPRAGRKHNDE
jgi:hypothetical protein